jgi:WD40 repeat protein
MNRRNILACLLAVAVGLPIVARAEHTRYWRQTDFSDFEKGTANGVAIRSDGKLAPAPKFDSFADPNLAYIWALRLDSHNHLYAAGGSNAKVLRLDDAGQSTTVFESQELVAQAIVFDSKDNLYVGTSPDGKVYEVTPAGKKSIFFDPKSHYIWALAFDPHGTLFVATGDKGQVFEVEPDGRGQLFYQSEERHARSLAFDERGNLLIGTEPDGLILRVPIERKTPQSAPTAGSPFVIYETSKAEVTSLLADAQGNIYAASIGEKNRAPAVPRIVTPPVAPTTVPPTNPANVISGQTQPTQPPQQPITSYSFPPISATGGAEVVKIAPDGSPDTIWTSRDDLVFAMGLPPTGKILLGTGNEGAVVQLEDNDVYANVAKAESAQVTSFAVAPDDRIFVATANPGKIFTLGPGFATKGSFESDTFDAKIFSHWGRITWWGQNGATEGKVTFYIRSGNTSNPGENWSAWSGPYEDPGRAEPDCPPARFVQWKAVFVDTDKGLPPDVSWVDLAYLPKNVAPVIDDIAIQAPGIRVVGFAPQPSGPGTALPVQLRYPRSAGVGSDSFATVSVDGMNQNPPIEVPPQGFRDKSYQSVLWSAHDDNDDSLVFSVYYRSEGEQNWRLLKGDLKQKYYSWDTTTMPDGAYYLKIVASDEPSNPPNQALSAERQSDRFQVANTPPQIVNLRAGSGLLNTKASFDATSSSGAIARAEYSIDSGDWKIVFPVGLLSDSPKESYYLQLPGLPPGEHTFAVQVTDQFDNTAAAKVTFTVEPRGTQ